jgi:Topoisomerase 6 subunit A/Spo11, Toprim domain
MIDTKDILAVTKSVTKKWEKQRKAEERGRSQASRQYIYSDRVDFTEVAERILPDAYAHASGNGQFTVSKRQLYYASREKFRVLTGREIEANYFSQTILVQYMNQHPNETASWKITADPRGTLTISNAAHEVRVPCGTIAIDEHLANAKEQVDPLDVEARLPIEWPSLAEGKRYQGVLYIEKEGFEPILKEARIAERFDLATLSCKGQSVVAARKFVDDVCRRDGGVPLFVVHDFDKSGFEISKRLTTVSDWAEKQDRVAYRFENVISVHDLGLRLLDIEKYGLAEEECVFKGRRNWNADKFCTDEEEAFLRSGKRVELNAFTSPQIIEWLESKLSEHLPSRLVPDDDTLADAYRRALSVAEINAAIEEASELASERAREATVPRTLRHMLKQEIKDSAVAWDKALYFIAKKQALSDRQ